MLAPNNNRGMTYQTDEKHLNIFLEYFVGVIKLHLIVITIVFYYMYLPIISLNIYKMWHRKNLLNVTLPRLAPYPDKGPPSKSETTYSDTLMSNFGEFFELGHEYQKCKQDDLPRSLCVS